MRGLWRRVLGRRSRIAAPTRAALAGRRALEIGGPSRIYSRRGRIPLYPVLASLDRVEHAAATLWHPEHEPGAARKGADPHGRPSGRDLVMEAGDLAGLEDGEAEAVLASHVLEHLANPLQALGAWRRVLSADGRLVLVVPHRDGTFDHRRPVTGMAHLLDDLSQATGEDDMTHLDEILRLHDHARDRAAGGPEAFAARCRDNARVRAMHHHVFDTALVIEALDEVGFAVEALDVMTPYHVAILARPDPLAKERNAALLLPEAAWRRASPFATDRVLPAG